MSVVQVDSGYRVVMAWYLRPEMVFLIILSVMVASFLFGLWLEGREQQ